jgi:hypothetical protein
MLLLLLPLLLLLLSQVYVLADTSYNPLSVDEVAAAHVNADCVVSTWSLAGFLLAQACAGVDLTI